MAMPTDSVSHYARMAAARDPMTIARELDRLQRKIRHYETALSAIANYHSGVARAFTLEAIRKGAAM